MVFFKKMNDFSGGKDENKKNIEGVTSFWSNRNK